MNTDLILAFATGAVAVSIFHSLRAELRLWRASTPREPNPELTPRVTPHMLMVDGWREERGRIEGVMEEARDHLIETRRAELLGEAVPQSHRPRLERVLQVAGDNLRDLNTAIAEDKRANQ